MPKVRLATFNIENLFARPTADVPQRADDRRLGMVVFDDPAEARTAKRIAEATLSDDERQLTAQALIDLDADVVALQEVDSEEALRLFRDLYIHRTLQPRIAAAIKAELPQLRTDAAQRGAGADKALKEAIRTLKSELERQHNYGWLRVIDGNDQRGIDVGVLSRLALRSVTSHAHATFREFGLWNTDVRDALKAELSRFNDERAKREPTEDDRVFRRDCLEVDIEAGGGKVLTLFICHFKANPPAREFTRPLRLAEATAVRRLIERRFGHGAGAAAANWAICGDLNDYMDIDGSSDMPDLVTGRSVASALEPLLGGTPAFAIDVMGRIADPADRWTSYFGRDDIYTQLDHILISPALAATNPSARPRLVRSGQPYRAARHTGSRYPRVGWDRPKASDHCPFVIELEIP
jgi:endonuclease/exonuclease/phosphatase family metal-dependent hydrolase